MIDIAVNIIISEISKNNHFYILNTPLVAVCTSVLLTENPLQAHAVLINSPEEVVLLT